jgi:prepilin-type N-terminal cleavage/methylation domain-containing protein
MLVRHPGGGRDPASNLQLNMNFRSGFTLIELLLVIALIGALAAFSTPFYARFLTQNSVAVVRDELSSHLHRAQFNAMMGENNGPWGVTYSASKLILFQGSSYAARTAALDEAFTINPSISISGLGEVIYAKTSGLPNSTPTVTISGVGSSKTITVNSQGAVQQ